jgi:RsiW-degrading membrane proteinase PrsW (M82 family)
MALFLSLIVAAAIVARLVARYDLYDREPWHVTAAVIVAGGMAMAVAGPIEDWAIGVTGAGNPSVVLIAGVAAIVEETWRFVIVAALARLLPRHFNDPMDGLIYGSSAGIGMALEETAAQLARESSAPLAGTVAVEAVRLFGHVIMGGITGFGLGVIYCRPPKRAWRTIAIGCLAAGVMIHFLWDYAALAAVMYAGWEAVGTIGSIGLTIVATGLYGALVIAGSRASRAAFAAPAPPSRDVVDG